MASRHLSSSGKRSENQEKQASNKTVLLAEESLDLQIRTVSEEVDKKDVNVSRILKGYMNV